MIRAALSLIRLVAVLTAISMAAVGISVAISGFLRAQTATFTSSELGERTSDAPSSHHLGHAARQCRRHAAGLFSRPRMALLPALAANTKAALRHVATLQRPWKSSGWQAQASAGGAYAHSVLAIEEMEQARD